MANKVKFGLKSCFFAPATDDGNGNLTYSTPVALPGAVSISMEASGESNPFYADNVVYFTANANSGYSGDLELALIPDSFRTAILGETQDAKGMYLEHSNDTQAEFALLFQFEGDESATRHCFYRCSASRPSVSGSTKEETIEPQTESITLTAMARISDELVKARCPYASASTSAYQTWFSAVVEPTAV